MLELAHERLYWPEPDQIWEPSGSGPKVYAQLASEKIGEKIRREFPEDARGVEVSVLAPNPEGDETEAPIAIVCQFSKPVSPAILRETHRLAWSFSRARSLITIEPQLLRVWSCCEPPKEQKAPDPVFMATETDLAEQAADALQWVELVSGQFFQKYEGRFRRSGAADQMLLNNLKEVRRQLQDEGLDNETIHDLLARIIFIQFLFQKQDSNGTPALNERILQDLHTQGILSKAYRELPEILDDFDDTYKLFRWLNNKFNGDLFPGKGETEEERQAEWQAEIQKVWTEDNRYLSKLAQFVRGDLEMQSGQLSLWKYYSFDVIPLDFISSIYEEFVNKKAGEGVHYTPEYIVDFILDGVLPWNEQEWDLKIIDPACGSGIFLVKAFQRLIYRWEEAHDSQRIQANVLKTLLENNIFGVDIDKEAVRVASFSLYLTMLDSIDPLEYWENEVRFPRLRNQQLINSDFFTEDKEGFRTNEDLKSYDLILGNAPWGEKSVTKLAKSWADEYGWAVADDNIGPLFLAKSISLVKSGGTIALIQPAATLLSSHLGPAKEFRTRLFREFKVEEIVNLSALRFKVFPNAVSPPCIISGIRSSPDEEPFYYICPKPTETQEDGYKVIIEPHDINMIYPHEVDQNPTIWATLMWGNRRDLALISRLSKSQNLNKLEEQSLAVSTLGIQRGKKQGKETYYYRPLLDKKILETSDFPKKTFLYLRTEVLDNNEDPYAERSRKEKFEAFNSPQLIIKRSWTINHKRFKAAVVSPSHQSGIICTKAYVSVHIKTDDSNILDSACLSYNSKLAVYYLLLSSGRFAFYRPEPNVEDLLQVPIPECSEEIIQGIKTFDDIDYRIYDAFSLKESERVLIEDLFDYTLPDFKGDSSSPGRQKTHRTITNLLENKEEPELREYCEYFLRVIRAGFGQNKKVCATIFQESTNDHLPVRLVAIYLNKSIHDGIRVKTISSQVLLNRLNRLNNLFMEKDDSDTGGIFYQRVARVYDSTEWHGERVPTVYLIKPDKIRYWIRAMALRDADEVSADIMLKHTHLSTNSETVPLS
ncbi:N-6 DNA methylase [Coleofasciculus sp. FACHB-501]|uniref:HsdM family class I SAM-dependent methyltransferase n=1 Tax=Cyanophyceae TaxID=3028117 RepID=UPI001F54976A|nr:N-6 DNA methylase [Coleofasciculus sp. FACHB-501]